MKCPNCGTEHDNRFCPECGQAGGSARAKQNNSGLRCPKCGSTNINVQMVTLTSSKGKTKGFGAGKACLGWLVTGPFGILCGLCGMGKGKTKTKTDTKKVRICQNCGKEF